MVMPSEDSEAIKYLTQRIDDIHSDVRYLRDHVVTKDDCRDRHTGIDRGLDSLVAKSELVSLEKTTNTKIKGVEEDLDDLKKPLWAVVIAVAVYMAQWAMGKLTG